MGLVNGPQTKIWHAVASSEQADMKITGKGASNQILGAIWEKIIDLPEGQMDDPL